MEETAYTYGGQRLKNLISGREQPTRGDTPCFIIEEILWNNPKKVWKAEKEI
jgi:hypothetical protein